MSTKYFALLTQLGADKLANAAALGTKIEITHMAVGDGGGSLPTPDTRQTKLVNEKRRAAINALNIDPKNTNHIMVEQVIPESEGGWWIREIGLFDKDGILIAVGNCAETYKPQLQEGSGRTQTIRMVLIVSHTDAVTLKVDPSVVLATREYADAAVVNAIREHEQSRRHPDATLKERGFVSLSSAVNSNSETQAATPKAVKTAYDLAATAHQNAANANNNANARLEKSKNGADIPNKSEFVKNLGLADVVDRALNSLDTRTGGGINGDVTVKQLLTQSLVLGGGSLVVGSRDAASFEGNNIEIRSWYGVGFKSTHNNPNDVTSIYFNTRNGDIASQGNLSILKNVSTKGKMTADGGFIAGDESQNASLTPWGDIRGATWGGWLSHWLNASFARKNSGVFSGKGWFKDESTGLIIQWGAESESNRNFNFPHMFSEACFVVLVTNSTSQGARIDNAFGYPVNNSEFYAATKREDGIVNNFPVAWLAIGR
ncbi:phage tail protein [Xenorhabdus eapokensis]|uniref:Phage tail protein n=1 Tax=Xenorhabdus eapokensis TaxID=1873482 RepID=A0A1Q5TUM5_9GAMM|nr:phage tail protein [Xenorhabdus eapokensis]OKP03932.1 phage tail protein [Xenorhabdus eapokensis]